MDNKIKQAAKSLKSINVIMEKFVNGESLSFDEAWKLLTFYRTYKDTTPLINNAEELAHQDIKSLYGNAQELLSGSATTMQMFETSEDQLYKIDFNDICNQHMEPYDQAWRSVSEVANKLWRESSAISNRLDYMDYADPEFSPLDKKFDTLRAEYYVKKKEYEGLYGTYREEHRRIAGLFCFDISLISILAAKLHRIAHDIINDINRIWKEGSL